MARQIKIRNLAPAKTPARIVVEDHALKAVRVGDVLARSGRSLEAAAVYRRAARSFEKERRFNHARAAWRLVLKILSEDIEARGHIVDLGGLPTAPDRRGGFQTQVLHLDPSEVEGTIIEDENWEITDPGSLLDDPILAATRPTAEQFEPTEFEPTAPGKPNGSRRPVGFVALAPSTTGPLFDVEEFTMPSEPTES